MASKNAGYIPQQVLFIDLLTFLFMYLFVYRLCRRFQFNQQITRVFKQPPSSSVGLNPMLPGLDRTIHRRGKIRIKHFRNITESHRVISTKCRRAGYVARHSYDSRC